MRAYFDSAGARHDIPDRIFDTEIQTGVTPAEAEALEELARGRVVLEVGSWYGFSTVIMARMADLVVAVDHHQGDVDAGSDQTLPAFLANLRRYEVADCVVPLIASSELAVPLLPDAYFGLVFVDAAHDEASVLQDLDLCWPKLARGGAFAFHDYGRFQVAGPVDRLGLMVSVVDSLAWVVKP